MSDFKKKVRATGYSVRVFDLVCKGLGVFTNWPGILGRCLLKKEDQSPSVFLKSWMEPFLSQNKMFMSFRRKQQGLFFSFKKPLMSTAPFLKRVPSDRMGKILYRHYIHKKSMLADASASVLTRRRQWNEYETNQAVCHQLLYSRRGGGADREFAKSHPK